MKHIKNKVEIASNIMVYTLLLYLFGPVYVLVSLCIDQWPLSTGAVIISTFSMLFVFRVCDAFFEFLNGGNVMTLDEKLCALLVNCVFLAIMGKLLSIIWAPECHKISIFELNLGIGLIINIKDVFSGKSLYVVLIEYCRSVIDFTRKYLTEIAVSAVTLIIMTIFVLLPRNDIFDYIIEFVIVVMLCTVITGGLYTYCIHRTRDIPGGPDHRRKRH